YLTRVRRDGGLSSAVFEWNGNGLTVVADGLEWFFQAQYLPHEEKAAIVGQKAGALSGSAANLGERGLFAPGIYRLQWQSETLVSQGRLDLPEGTQIYGFASGDLMGNGGRQVLRYSRRDLLQLFNSENVEEWCSADAYGGSTTYLEVAVGIDPEDNARYYLAQRLRLAAGERDQKYRAIVSRNEEAGRRIFRRFRKFTGGWMEILAWNGVGLQTEWQSQRLAGYVSDFVLADMDHDGRRDLVYAQVSGSGSFSRSSKSRIYIQALEGIF
ncbi:hypothetical protein, partial [Desulfosarcina sp.]|uniref:hypothetical protein n=1 Tax=Desulfosarcina sp. TaxID=2027861 RepID=UPI0039709E35